MAYRVPAHPTTREAAEFRMNFHFVCMSFIYVKLGTYEFFHFMTEILPAHLPV